MPMLVSEAIVRLQTFPPNAELRLCATDIVEEGGTWPIDAIVAVDDGHDGGTALIEAGLP